MLFALLLEQLVGNVVVEDGGVNIDQLKLSLDAFLSKMLRNILIKLLDFSKARHEYQQ